MKSFSRPAIVYLWAIQLTGILLLISHINHTEAVHTWPVLVLCTLASLALILKVEGITDRSYYTFSLVIYGFTLAAFGMTETVLVIVVSHLVEWLWNRPPWFLQLFNIGMYLVAMEAAGLVYFWINQGNSPDTWRAAPAILFGMAVFNGLKHLLAGLYLWLARGESFRKSGVFDFFPLMLDLSLLYFGASLSIVWNYNPFALMLFVIPTYLLYSALRVPALQRKTEIDSKTGLFNHSYFKKQLDSELARSKRFDRPLAVIMADLDLLRNINNTYGHLAGDEVLIGVARAMKQAVRDYDVVCRFGGEEFAILMPETTLSQACQRAELIRRMIEGMEFTVPTSKTPIRATMSFGVAHRENFRQTAEEIVHHADLALYQSKLNGRNRTHALANQTYLDFPVHQTDEIPKNGLETSLPATAEPISLLPDLRVFPKKQFQPAESSELRGKEQALNLLIAALTELSILLLAGLLIWIRAAGSAREIDWLGLLIISALIVLLEGFSVELYTPQSAVSTSAIPVIAAYMLFGPLGVIWVGLLLAFIRVLKNQHTIQRFIFNVASYLVAGTCSLGLLGWAGSTFEGLAYPSQIVVILISSLILYLSTSFLTAAGMSEKTKQTTLDLWRDQFSRLAPYYIGIGLIAYALVIGYRFDPIFGLVLMAAPMIFLRINQKQFMDRTRQMVTELREKNQILNRHSREIFDLNEGLLTTLSEIIDHRDTFTVGHSKQVSEFAAETARVLGLSNKQIDLIRRVGLLHDIGKLGIPVEILSKPGSLTAEEYKIVKEHAALGGDLVKNSPSLRPLGSIIRHHHEFYNGSGYPDGLAGSKISLEARIIAVADAIEAMTADRPYRRALSLEQVIGELQKHSGTQFDPMAVRAAVTMLQGVIAAQSIHASFPDAGKTTSASVASQ
ncbi:MAG TPA: diguanylate cyclase [Anaerolineales bacterium]|nr:diguanylate cyclase [Anaerolineales bacterium]